MKKLRLILASLAVCFPVAAQVGPITIDLSTNRITAATTNSTASTAYFIGNQKTVNFLLSGYSTNAFNTGGAGDTNGTVNSVTVRLEGSQDGTTYFTYGTNWDIVLYPTFMTNTATPLGKFVILDSTPVQYFRARYIMSTLTNAVWFPTVSYWYK